jgi:hypothetical protein
VVGAPELRDRAPAVLEQLLTAQATKRPRSETQIGQATGCRPGEVRAVLSGLARAGLARPLDPERGVWELSHDFVARVVSRHLGQGRRAVLWRAAAYAAPALLVTTLALGAGAVTWERMEDDRAVRLLLTLGMSVSEVENQPPFLRLHGTSALTVEKLEAAAPALKRLAPRLLHISLRASPIADLRPLSSLTALETIDLSHTAVVDLAPLSGARVLRRVDVTNTAVADLTPLSGLAALQSLDVTNTAVANLTPLSGARALRSLHLSGTDVFDLGPLSGAKALQSLRLSHTAVADLAPLSGASALQDLHLSNTRVANLAPLSGLEALQSLHLTNTAVKNLAALSGARALRSLHLSGTAVSDLDPLSGAKALQSLYLLRTRVADPAPLSGLMELQSLSLPVSVPLEVRRAFDDRRRSRGLRPLFSE